LTPRANWKGFLKVAELPCPVALYTAASSSEPIALPTLNRATGHHVRRQFVDLMQMLRPSNGAAGRTASSDREKTATRPAATTEKKPTAARQPPAKHQKKAS